jgi:hypothetical protein
MSMCLRYISKSAKWMYMKFCNFVGMEVLLKAITVFHLHLQPYEAATELTVWEHGSAFL